MSIYQKLGVATIINGAGAMTRLSGSIMPKEVVDAMMEASKDLVEIEYLQAKASEVIAEITGAEAGMVTTGAAAGLVLSTASCITGLDIAKMERLPDTSGMRNEVVICRHQRNAYDHGIRLTGVRLVEAGLDERAAGVGTRTVEPWEIEAAISDKTAAIAYVARPRSSPPVEEVARIAKDHGVPLIVDAAAELPPASNLRKFIAAGASAVNFSGGKAIRGPQASGILCGKREIVTGAILQQLDMDCRFELWNPPPNLIDKSKLKGIPRHGIGRGFKAGKEEIMGLITALRLFAARDEQQELREYETKVSHIVEALQSVKMLEARVLPSSEFNPIPMAEIRFLHEGGLPYMIKVSQHLASSQPALYLDDNRIDEMVLQVNPFNLRNEQLDVIIERVKVATLIPNM